MSLLDLSPLEDVVDVSEGEIRRVQKVEWENDFPCLVVGPNGEPNPQWRLSDIPIESNPSIRLDFRRLRDRPTPPPSLVEIPRRELVPGTAIVNYVFDRNSKSEDSVILNDTSLSALKF